MSALIYCTGSDLDLAETLTFYAIGNSGTHSAAASIQYETYAQAEFDDLKPGMKYTYYAEAVTADGRTFRSDEGTFETPAPKTSHGWLELPAMGDVSTAKEHVFRSGERNYTAYYDTGTYSSLWVAYPLARGHSGSLSRPSKWSFAPGIAESSQVDLRDYSYNDNYSRGHQIPNGDRNGNSGMQNQTFYVINSVPQIQNGFNGSIWASLETGIRNAVPSRDSLYVTTGPVYKTVGGSESLKYTSAKEDTKRLPVPNYFFKVVMKVKRSGGQITDAMAVGFWFEHKAYSDSNYEAHAVSVDFIEQKTGYDFFANLPDALEAVAEVNSSWSAFEGW